MKSVIKRDGTRELFDSDKIRGAILKAFNEVDGEITLYAEQKADNIAQYIFDFNEKETLTIEEIQDLVEKGLMSTKRKDVAKAYILYRDKRTQARGNIIDKDIDDLLLGINDYWNKENSNKNATEVTTQRDYIAGIVNTDLTRRKLLTKDIVEAHDEGIIHFHDSDYFAQNALNNCGLINLDDMLQNGTVVNGVMIEKPHKFLTAATIATQIILGVSSSQYGGCTVSMTHLAPFVRDSYNYYYNLVEELSDKYAGVEYIEEEAWNLTKKEIEAGVQTFNYQVNSMTNTNGQSPFISVNLYLGETKEYKKELAMIIEEFLKQRILGLKNEKGVYITQAFPKLLYVLEEDNIHKDSKYYYLTKLAAKCTAKRMVPDYISEKKMIEYKGACYPCMGCRSFLTPDRTTSNIANDKNYIKGNKYYGRFNGGVVTINLADIALSSKGNYEKFWELFEERTELCHRALKIRYNRLSKANSDIAPLLWQFGAYARLPKHTSIKLLLENGYATFSLGYAALYECVKYMTGVSHTSKEGKKFGIEVMQKLNDKCNQWKKDENIDYSLYGTPIESTTYKFAKCLKKRFGLIEGITDRNYITNSYHIPVFEKIDAFTKLKLESEFQVLSPGGAISYIEVPNMEDNISAILELITFMYDNIMYAEINTKSDYCQKCGYDGEIKIMGKEGKHYWKCPNCGNTDLSTMNIVRRTCGYLGTNDWNAGRLDEINDRTLHVDF